MKLPAQEQASMIKLIMDIKDIKKNKSIRQLEKILKVTIFFTTYKLYGLNMNVGT